MNALDIVEGECDDLVFLGNTRVVMTFMLCTALKFQMKTSLSISIYVNTSVQGRSARHMTWAVQITCPLPLTFLLTWLSFKVKLI